MKVSLLFILVTTNLLGQELYELNLGGGTQGNTEIPFANIDFSAGYSIDKYINLSGGLVFTKSFLEFVLFDEKEEDITYSYLSFNLYLSSSKYFKLFELKQNNKFEYFGIFPEIRFYFEPYLPRKYAYEDNGLLYELKAEYQSKFSRGIGGGVFLKTESGLIALKVEFNTIDTFSTLRQLESDNPKISFTSGNQLLLTLRFSKY